MNNKFFTLFIFIPLFLLGFMNVGWGQVYISAGNTVTESFSIGTSATATLPTAWKVDKNATARTLGTYSAAGTTTEQLGGNNLSTIATNGIYNFGSGVQSSATDRSIGWLSSSSATKSGNLYVYLNNNGSGSITSFTISYNVEKYRNGSNAAGYRIQMYYSTDGSTWTSAGSDFLTSFVADADNNGYANAPGATLSVSSKTLTVPVAIGSPIYLAWNYSVTTGTTTSNAQALGIDDVNITAYGSLSAPTTQASKITFSNVQSIQMTVNWTNGDGAKRIVIMNTSNSFTDPTDGQADPAANTVYGGSGEQVVYNNNSNSVTVTGLTAGTTYWYRVYEYNGSGSTSKYLTSTATNNPNSQATNSASTPTITVTSLTGFGNVAVNTNSTVQSYTVSGVNLTDNIKITAPDGFQISTSNSPFTSSSPITLTQASGTVANTTIYVRFSPTTLSTYGGNISHVSSGATTQNVAVTGTGIGDQTSKIIVPDLQISAGNVSSLLTAPENAVSVFKFNISDLGTTDGLPTKVTSVKIFNTGNAVLSNVLGGAELWDGNTIISTSPITINSSDITFPIANGNLVISDGASKEITLKIYLKDSGITDGKTMIFQVKQTSHGFTADASGSGFATDFGAAVTGNTITIDVAATKLVYSQQPTNTTIGNNMTPAVTVTGCDANGNLDLDFTGIVNITSSGTLSSSPQTVNAVSGVATFNTINHTALGTGFTLSASCLGFADITSNTFDIIIQAAGILLLEENFDYTAGSLLTSDGWSAHSGEGTNNISVTSPGLNYDGYASTGIGNSAYLTTSGEDVNRIFSEQGSGSTTYAAFLVNFSSAQANGDYFIHFASSTITNNEFRCRLYAKDVSGKLRLGIITNSGTVAYIDKDYSYNTTYLIVIKTYFDASSQTSSLYINPSLYSEPTPDASETNTTSVSSNIGIIALRQGTAGNAPKCYIDGIRVGTGWGAVLGNPQYNSNYSIATGNYNNVSVLSNNLSLNGNVTVRGILNFTGGKVTLGANNLTMNSTTGITGYNSSKYIVTDGAGKLTINNVGNSEVTFPIGTATSYNPVYITNSGTADNFSANVKAGFTNAPPDSTKAIYREWNISEATTGGSDAKLRFQFNAADIGSQFVLNNAYSVGHYEGALWVGKEATLTGSDYPYTIDVSGITSFSPYAVGNQGAMPVSLKSLTSNVAGRNINLKWVTSEEINNAGFDVERKQAQGEYVKVGFVKGSGTVTSAKSYEFTDRNLMSGKYSYRLKQIDNNGNFEYFNLTGDAVVGVPVKFDLSQNYPNPFNPATKINFDLPKDSKLSLKLYDMLGREVSTLVNEFRTAGYYTVDFNASSLSSGIYFYRLLAGEFSAVKKLVVIK